jgi:hypothetical protein
MALMSYYDPQRDEILNCKPGSYAYAHEERHRWQYKIGLATKLDKLGVWCYYIACFAGALGMAYGGSIGLFLGIGIAMFPNILGDIGLELDAYIVGYINHRRDL